MDLAGRGQLQAGDQAGALALRELRLATMAACGIGGHGEAETRDWLEVYDAEAGCLVSVREAHRDGRWAHTEVTKLLPTPLRAA